MLTDEIIAAAERIIDNDQFEDLILLGRGLFKNVYLLPSESAVLKVMHNPRSLRERRSFEFEWALYVTAHRVGSGHLFPDTIMGESELHGMYFIQELCSIGPGSWAGPFRKIFREAEYLGVTDMHDSNVGETRADDRPVVVDWGYDHPSYGSIAEQVWDSVCLGSTLPR